MEESYPQKWCKREKKDAKVNGNDVFLYRHRSESKKAEKNHPEGGFFLCREKYMSYQCDYLCDDHRGSASLRRVLYSKGLKCPEDHEGGNCALECPFRKPHVLEWHTRGELRKVVQTVTPYL